MDANNNPKTVDLDESFTNQSWDKDTFALARKVLARFPNIQHADREDIIQEFAIKHPNMEGYGRRSKLSTWLRSCLKNRARDFLRELNQTRTIEKNRIVVESITQDEYHAAHQLRQGRPPCPGTMEIVYYVFAAQGPFWKDEVELGAYLVTKLVNLAFSDSKSGEEVGAFPFEVIGNHLMECDACARLATKIKTQLREHGLNLTYLAMHHLLSELLAEDLCSTTSFFVAGSNPQRALQALNQEINELLDEPGDHAAKRQRVCSNCKKPGHNART